MNPKTSLAHLTPFPLHRAMGASAAAFVCLAMLATPTLAVEDEDAFYQLGVAVGRSLSEFQLSDKELATVQKGMNDMIDGKPASGPSEEIMKRLGEIRTERVTRIATAYLAEAKSEKGAQVQPSGLIYFEVEEGSGASPLPTDTVSVHYHGTLSNGAVFDSSRDRGQPTEFPLNRVIPCWTEGVGKMKVGGKSRLVCPPEIAYGERGAPPTIPGGSVLSFEVELLEIKAASSATPEG